MGFFQFEEQEKKPRELKGFSVDLLHKKECAVCPLNGQQGLRNPHMEPTGSKNPIVYMLGEAPGKEEDRRGVQFVGRSGRVLRFRIPEQWNRYLRWNNVVRTRPPDNREPTMVEMECCRPSIVRDIEATQPAAIFGFGGVPLDWALGESGITKWAGRRIPIKVGKHVCWFFPMLHPSYVMRSRKFEPRSQKDYGSDVEFAFATHLRDAFASIDGLPTPVVLTREDALEGIRFVTGANGKRDVDAVLDFIDSCYDEKAVGFDYETTGLRPYKKGAAVLTVGISKNKESFSFPLYHREAQWTAAERETVQNALEDFLYEARCKKVVHGLAFEQEWSGFFYGEEVILAGQWEDTQSQAYILDERPWTHSLDFLAMQYFGLRIKEIDNLNRKAMAKEPLIPTLRYNAMDAKFHLMLYGKQTARLLDEGLMGVYRQHMRRVPTMVLTQLKGIPIDQTVVTKFRKRFEGDLDDIEDDIADLEIVRKFERNYGRKFRPSANDDILLAYRKLANVPLAKTEAKELKLYPKVPLGELIIEWREANKLYSTYIVPVGPKSPHIFSDGMLHPIVSTNKTVTWRTSSEDPNIQNWPMHGKKKEIRKQVRPGGDLRVVAFDFAGIQARNVAMESLDPTLIKHYWNRYDIHGDWRGRILRQCPDWISRKDRADKNAMKEYRQESKNKFVFPSFFGAQPKTLAGGLGIMENDAADLLAEFFDEFPEIKRWQEKVKTFYMKHGYVTGLSKFRRRAPVAQNEMINSPIQSDESIIVCGAMERLSRMGEPRFQANLMIHDDLTFIWPKHEIDRNSEVVVREMVRHEFNWTKIVPLGVEVKVGLDWCTLETIGEYESTKDGGFVEIRK